MFDGINTSYKSKMISTPMISKNNHFYKMVKKITVISSSFSPDIGPGSIRTSQMVEELSRNNKNYITVITQEA